MQHKDPAQPKINKNFYEVKLNMLERLYPDKHVKKVEDIDQFLLLVFDYILHLFNVDIFNKFYDTATTNVGKNAKINSIIWDKQEIRGKDVVTHSKSSIDNIIQELIENSMIEKV